MATTGKTACHIGGYAVHSHQFGMNIPVVNENCMICHKLNWRMNKQDWKSGNYIYRWVFCVKTERVVLYMRKIKGNKR